MPDDGRPAVADLGRWPSTVLDVMLAGVDLHRPIRWAGSQERPDGI